VAAAPGLPAFIVAALRRLVEPCARSPGAPVRARQAGDSGMLQ